KGSRRLTSSVSEKAHKVGAPSNSGNNNSPSGSLQPTNGANRKARRAKARSSSDNVSRLPINARSRRARKAEVPNGNASKLRGPKVAAPPSRNGSSRNVSLLLASARRRARNAEVPSVNPSKRRGPKVEGRAIRSRAADPTSVNEQGGPRRKWHGWRGVKTPRHFHWMASVVVSWAGVVTQSSSTRSSPAPIRWFDFERPEINHQMRVPRIR